MVIIKNLLSAQEVQAYRERLREHDWQDGKATAMGMAAQVKRNRQADASDSNIRELANHLLGRMGDTPKLISAALPQRIFPPVFNQYGECEEYGYHVDAAIMRIPGSHEVLRSDMSMTLFLSEPDEYEGGELVIATDYGEERVKLAAGDAVVYPSRSLHKVTAVTKGTRIAAITWMQSMVSDVTLRDNLFQLDQTIQGLISEGKSSREQLDKLHYVYHNLIRQFAQV